MSDLAAATAGGGIESSEALREALFALQHEHDALRRSHLQAQHLLDALEALLAVQLDDDPFARVFASLRKVFDFEQAMLLTDDADGSGDGDDAAGGDAPSLRCIVAEPAGRVGERWPLGSLLRKVLAGRVVATFAGADGPAHDPSVGAQSALHMPVRTRDRRGVLTLLRPAGGGGFDRDDITLGRRFAVLASHALAARHASQTVAEGRRLRELTEQLRENERVTRRNAELLQALVNMLPVGVAVQDARGKLLLVNDMLAATVQRPREALAGQQTFDLFDAGPADAERRRQAFRAHLASGEQHSRERTLQAGGQARTLLVTGKPVRIFDEQLMLSTLLDITERKLLEQDLARRAFHDALTGLPNRVLMHDVVNAALARHRAAGTMFALAFIDLDNFKQVNDYYSHAIGDALLKAVTQRVAHSIRGGDTLARISGDEFLLLIDPLQQQDDLPPLIERVIDALKQPFQIEGHELLTSASVGAAVFPLHGESFEDLCRCADGAMYRAKNRRKGSAAYFDDSMGQALTARMETEQRLRAALRDRRFRVAFQPKLRLADQRVQGVEALVRWVDHDGRVHPPGSFIDVASELGLLDEITHFVVDEVARQLPALTRHFGAHLSVSINVSAGQAGDSGFMAALLARLARSGIARRVTLELTEDALLAVHRFQQESLPRLRAAGVRISIDDFGTGYSSLSLLADITADEVKIDRSLISAIHDRPRSQGILRAIESLAGTLGMEIVAEGVETAAELAYLRRHTGITLAQGYHFSPPRFLDALLREQRAPAAATAAAAAAG
ncbi:MAG: EAL domain-containing protein [Rubrivivax sp.]